MFVWVVTSYDDVALYPQAYFYPLDGVMTSNLDAGMFRETAHLFDGTWVEADRRRHRSLGKYYVENLELASGPTSPAQAAAALLVSELKRRGKWPAKPDLAGWYGKKGSRWRDARSGAFKR